METLISDAQKKINKSGNFNLSSSTPVHTFWKNQLPNCIKLNKAFTVVAIMLKTVAGKRLKQRHVMHKNRIKIRRAGAGAVGTPFVVYTSLNTASKV